MEKCKDKEPYNPLPEYLAIGPSQIHGAGILAKEDIPGEVVIGISHVYDPNFQHNYIRTPLGGFINHSNTANVVKVELLMTNQEDPKLKFDYKKWNLITLRDIKEGEELTIRYTFYNV